jgi:integrase
MGKALTKKAEPLTAKQVEHAKPTDKRQEIAAWPPKGLYLRIEPSGSKAWIFRYRWHGRTRGMMLNPRLTLAAARAEAQAIVDTLNEGRDPAILQAAEVAAVELKQESVKTVGVEWLDREIRPEKRGDEERIREKRWYEVERILLKETKSWNTRDISSIEKPDVMRLLDGIVDRGKSVMACRTRAVLIRFFAWARVRGYIEASPMVDVPKPGEDHKQRDRVLTDAELFDVWTAAGELPYPTGPFIRFLILTAQRRGETATMRWRDVDMKNALWTLPKEATKAGRVHDVPLSTAAVALLKELPTWTKGDYVWTTTSGAIPVNGFSKMKTAADEAIEKSKENLGTATAPSIDPWTMHDLRRTGATGMAKASVPPHVLAAILNHTPGSTQGVTSIYNRFRYTEERRAALEAWGQHVIGLTAEKAKATA